MEFKGLELADRVILEPLTRSSGRWQADTNFSNLFMWRHSREISFCIQDGQLIIQTRYAGQNPFIFYPIGKGDKKAIIESMIAHYAHLGLPLEIHSLQASEKDELLSLFGDSFEITQRRDRFDYIYNVEELIALSGRKFHKKKNHLNRFYLQYPQACFEPLNEGNLQEVREVNNQWFLESKKDDEGLHFENLGINDALCNFNTLGLQGGLLRCDGDIIAFSFGEVLDEKMALIHIEKANIAFSGAYQAINQALLKHTFSHLQYVNREEDLGIEGLRKAKLSYQPAFLLEKYDARLSV